jgi:hypothetical protein
MTLSDLFENKDLKADQITCHSGGAEGADTEWEKACELIGVKVNAYSYKIVPMSKDEAFESSYTTENGE